MQDLMERLLIINNLVVDAGSNGAFIDNRGPASGDIVFVNNTFINPGEAGIKCYNELTKNKYYNNIFAGTSTYFTYGSGAIGEESNNLCKASLGDCGFVNPGSGNYKLSAGSAAKDKGLNSSGYGVITDLDNRRRPSGAAHDIGAYEY
jgi:hypothetical protein